MFAPGIPKIAVTPSLSRTWTAASMQCILGIALPPVRGADPAVTSIHHRAPRGTIHGMGWLKLLALAGAAALVWRATRRPPAPPRSAHLSESEADYRRARHRILVLGGGFGGLAAALALERQLGGQPDTSILVVDRDNSSLFTPLLWTVADGRADAADL